MGKRQKLKNDRFFGNFMFFSAFLFPDKHDTHANECMRYSEYADYSCLHHYSSSSWCHKLHNGGGGFQ
eukprot:1885226-Amphidinium_carterae.1